MGYKIALLNFNNYVNRKIRRLSTPAEYLTYKVGDLISVQSFNPNDGVDTNVTLNIPEHTKVDYLVLLYDSDLGIRSIQSRWFIIDMTRTRGGQYVLNLHRDVISDNYNNVLNSPAFIKRATLSQNDPYIFNDEGIQFNQIKRPDQELTDATQSGWIVGYVAKQFGESPTDKSFSCQKNTAKYIAQYTSFDDPSFTIKGYCEYSGHTGSFAWLEPYKKTLNINANIRGEIGYNALFNIGYGGQIDAAIEDYTAHMALWLSEMGHNIDRWRTLGNIFRYNSFSLKAGGKTIWELIDQTETSDIWQLLYSFIDKNIKIGNTVYKCQLVTSHDQSKTVTVNSGSKLSLIKDIARSTQGFDTTDSDTDGVSYTVERQGFKLRLVESPESTVTTQIKDASMTYLNDAPYRMFAIPYVNYNFAPVGFKINNVNYSSDSEACMAIANQIATDLGGTGTSFIYDMQLLPYCPTLDQFEFWDDKFDLDELTEHVEFELIKLNNVPAGFMLFPKTSSFSVDINKTITVADKKISNQLDMYRLCSPNYQGSFDFSAAKNNGVTGFTAQCTYKPYNPFINIKPIWNASGIYGGETEYKDARGLICGGDFSLPIIDDAWTDYNITNKNFLNIFDRQTQTLDLQNKYNRTNEIIGAVSGSISGAASGAITGAAGGPIGAIVGGVVGGVASGVGGIIDVNRSEELRQEHMSARSDIFNMQLGNVKALPQSLSKVGAQTAIYRIWPILELYTCTDAERQAFINTLKWRGMTVNRPGTISEFVDDDNKYTDGIQFISAELLDCQVTDDSHMLNTIQSELSRGVYFIKEA